MAQLREAGDNVMSPNSSSCAAESYKQEGTPDTRITAFSPDETADRPATAKSNSFGPLDPHPVQFAPNVPTFARTVTSLIEKDPFVTHPSATKPRPKLSPTASDFRPLTPAALLQDSASGSTTSERAPPGSAYRLALKPSSSEFTAELQLSRVVTISSPTRILDENDGQAILAHVDQNISPLQGSQSIHSISNGVHVHCTDIRDAMLLYHSQNDGNSDWEVKYVLSVECSQAPSSSPQLNAPRYGRVTVHVTFTAGSRSLDAIESIVGSLLRSEGAIFAAQRLVFNDSSWSAQLEYCDTDCAKKTAAKYNQLKVDGILISVFLDSFDTKATSQARALENIASPAASAATEDVAKTFNGLSISRTSSTRGLPHTPVRQSAPPSGYPSLPHLATFLGAQTMPQYYLGQMALGGQSTSPFPGSHSLVGPLYADHGAGLVPFQQESSPQRFSPGLSPGYGSPNGRRQHALRVTRSPFFNAATHHNHVDVGRIRDGVDVRTTIMLRNIPNKVDQAMLKRIIDESSWGKFDFMYLRIDFANDCNVGYAFINFVDPLDIVDFVNARGNQRWNCFKSDKVAEISYATIQGKDCLVQKFRNSSVMLEAPHYRPKLYFTSNGPRPELAGNEERFPEPDNQSKMKRSCENAEHVGLFTPNAGQHFRDEQRRRRSQYDRGTRLAALEEYDYDAHLYRA